LSIATEGVWRCECGRSGKDAEILKIFEQASLTRNRMEGRECSMSGETYFGKADDSKFETYPLHRVGLFICGQVVDLYSDIFCNFGTMGNRIHDDVRVIR
jgi:hypothetical protein